MTTANKNFPIFIIFPFKNYIEFRQAYHAAFIFQPHRIDRYYRSTGSRSILRLEISPQNAIAVYDLFREAFIVSRHRVDYLSGRNYADGKRNTTRHDLFCKYNHNERYPEKRWQNSRHKNEKGKPYRCLPFSFIVSERNDYSAPSQPGFCQSTPVCLYILTTSV